MIMIDKEQTFPFGMADHIQTQPAMSECVGLRYHSQDRILRQQARVFLLSDQRDGFGIAL